MNLLDSLLDAIVRLDGDALVMHVGEKPYVVTTSAAMNEFRGPLAWGQVELSSRVLTSEAVLGMLGQILPLQLRQTLEEYGAVEHEVAAYNTADRFTAIAARGGDDVWLELSRHRPEPVQPAVEEGPAPPAEEDAAVAADSPGAPAVPAAAAEGPALIEVAAGGHVPAAMDVPTVHVPEPAAIEVPPVAEPAPIENAADDDAAAVEGEVPAFAEAPATLDVSQANAQASPPMDVAPSHIEKPVDVAPVPSEQPVFADIAVEIEEPAAEHARADAEEPVARPPERLEERAVIETGPAHGFESESVEPVQVPPQELVAVADAFFPATPAAADAVAAEEDEVELAFGQVVPAVPPSAAAAAEPEAPFEIVQEVRQDAPTDDDVDALLAASAAALLQSAPVSHAPIDFDHLPLPPVEEAPEIARAFDVEAALAPAPFVAPADAAPIAPHEAPGRAVTQPHEARPAQAPIPSSPLGDLESPAIAHEAIDLIPPPQPEPRPAAAETEPQPVALAAESPSAAVPPEVVHVVERETHAIPAVTFDTRAPQHEPAPVVAEAEPQPVTLAQQPTAERAVILPLSRRQIRQEPSIPAAPHATPVLSIDELLRVAAARGASTVYLVAQSRPMVRADGEINVLEIGRGTPLAEADLDRLMLDMAPAGAREAWQRGLTAEWMCDVADVGRVRCMTFRDHRGPGLIFRMLPPQAISADQLGLTAEVQALCAQSDGLVLITGPRASGKSTLMASFVDLINRTRSDHVVTIESQIGFVHESRRSFISQREVREGESVAAGVRSALREDPDVLFISDLRSPETASAAVDAAESGRLVVASLPAASTVAAVDRMLELLPGGRRAQAQAALAASLRGVVAQVLVRRVRGGRVAAREVLLNTAAVASLIQEAKTAQLPLAIESGRRHGMMPLNDALAGFVRDGTVHVTEAYRKAFDKQALLTALRRDGIDTSFAEKLA